MEIIPIQELRAVEEGEYDSLLAWLNTLFGRPGTRFFQDHYAHVWGDRKGASGTSFVMKDGDRYLAHIRVCPIVLKTSVGHLPVAGIGQVAVDPGARGQGMVGRLMEKAHEVAVTQGKVACFLGGNRSLYAKFGYEICGHHYEWAWDRHCYPEKAKIRRMECAIDFDTVDRLWLERPHGVIWPREVFARVLRRPGWEHWKVNPEGDAFASVKVEATRVLVDSYMGASSAFIAMANALKDHYDRALYIRHGIGDRFLHSMMDAVGMDITRRMQGMVKILDARAISERLQSAGGDLSGLEELESIRGREFSPDDDALSDQRRASRKVFGDPFDHYPVGPILWGIERISYV